MLNQSKRGNGIFPVVRIVKIGSDNLEYFLHSVDHGVSVDIQCPCSGCYVALIQQKGAKSFAEG